MSVRIEGALPEDARGLDSRLWAGFARMAAAALLVAALLITLWIDGRPESRRSAEVGCRCVTSASCPCLAASRRSSP